jgi:CYTH domain-containing protein
MASEIERKFLVRSTAWKAGLPGALIRQGYLSTDKERTVRVRTAGERGWLAVKGLTTVLSRLEFEYEIPKRDADRMLADVCLQPLLEKTRYRRPAGAHVWEIDEFHGENAGLIVAEIELHAADERFERPGWLGVEVSSDPRYFNANLIRCPYQRWTREGGSA